MDQKMKKRLTQNDPLVLKQKIIYFQSELSRYKQKVRAYQDNYHYIQFDQLKSENEQLLAKTEEIKEQLANNECAHRRELEAYTEQIEGLKQKQEDDQRSIEKLNGQNQSLLAELKEKEEAFTKVNEHNQQLKERLQMLEAEQKKGSGRAKEVSQLQQASTNERVEQPVKVQDRHNVLETDSWFLRNLKETKAIKDGGSVSSYQRLHSKQDRSQPSKQSDSIDSTKKD